MAAMSESSSLGFVACWPKTELFDAPNFSSLHISLSHPHQAWALP